MSIPDLEQMEKIDHEIWEEENPNWYENYKAIQTDRKEQKEKGWHQTELKLIMETLKNEYPHGEVTDNVNECTIKLKGKDKNVADAVIKIAGQIHKVIEVGSLSKPDKLDIYADVLGSYDSILWRPHWWDGDEEKLKALYPRPTGIFLKRYKNRVYSMEHKMMDEALDKAEKLLEEAHNRAEYHWWPEHREYFKIALYDAMRELRHVRWRFERKFREEANE